MLLLSNLRKVVKLSFTSKIKIVFNETTEFSVVVSTEDNFNYTLHIEDVEADISDIKITLMNVSQNLPCDEVNGTYYILLFDLQHGAKNYL